MLVSEIPVAKTLYAKRLSDGKEFLVTSGFLIRGQGNKGGVNGVCKDGEKVALNNGTFTLFRK